MPEQLLPFIVTSFAIELTPGPNMAYLAVLSVDRGRAAGLAAVAGVALGLLVLGLLAGFGLGTIVSQTRWLFELLRWGGVAYLLWLAWDSYRDAQRPLDELPEGEKLKGFFTRGLVTNLLNPKAALFYVTVLPNFLVETSPKGAQSLALTLVYVAVATIVHAGIAVAGGSLQPILSSRQWRGRLGIVFAVLLVAVAIWLAATTHRSW